MSNTGSPNVLDITYTIYCLQICQGLDMMALVKNSLSLSKFFHNRVFFINQFNILLRTNRSANIREGSGRINANNKGKQNNNTTGNTGVLHERGPKERWKAQWTDLTGKKCTKSFSVAKYKEDAQRLAIEYREQEHNKKLVSLM
jgi:hypothetical protein